MTEPSGHPPKTTLFLKITVILKYMTLFAVLFSLVALVFSIWFQVFSKEILSKILLTAIGFVLASACASAISREL